MYVRSKIPAANLVRLLHCSCMQDCALFISCMAPRLARLLQGLVRLWPLLLQYARFLSKYIRFSCKMCQILMQASLQASCKSLMYAGADLGGGGGVQGVATPPNGQSHSIKCSTTNVLRYAQALIYIAKSLVVVVAVLNEL